MSSRVLYPPVLDNYMPAFQAGEGSKCRVYFSLSKFNAATDFSSLHVSVSKQGSGVNVINVQDDPENNRYRATGIILNVPFSVVENKENLYYFDILNEDLSSIDNTSFNQIYQGFIPGWIYKIQIRLSEVDYDNSAGQAAWLNNNASNFSEWSTVCITKAIGRMDLVIPPLGYNSSNENNVTSAEDVETLYLSTLDFFGKIISEDTSEILYKYNLKVFDSADKLLEDSGEQYSDQYQDTNDFRYLVKYEFENSKEYYLIFSYITNNGFSYTFKKRFDISLIQTERLDNCEVLTIDYDTHGIMEELTSLEQEEEEGRIALKLYSPDTSLQNINICIRRSSSKTNFQVWEDIKIFVVTRQIINDLPLIYDYTVESGVYYKYGVQPIDIRGNRGILNQSGIVMRDFEYSYLLGENNQQLKLMFNNTMQNYKIQLMESKIETIGGKYPIVTRNAALNYRVFPINGLISFWMDENHLFCDKKVIYGNLEIINLYNNANNRDRGRGGDHYHKNFIEVDSPSYEETTLANSEPSTITTSTAQEQYDYIYERDFRQMVLNFLHDGKPKLFKSPTEGNIIVRLTDINCVPNQTLDRMIYEFSSTGNEFAENNYDNYIKYNFLDPGTWSSELYTSDVRLGQLQMDFPVGANIIEEIYKRFDTTGQNYAGYRKIIKKIHNIRITIDDKPLRIYNNANEMVIGNNIKLNGVTITIYGSQRIYEFDSRLGYTRNDNLLLLGDLENKVQTVRATIDFLYDLRLEKYEAKKIQSQQILTGVGQIFNEYQSGVSIYMDILLKYRIDWEKEFRKLNNISSVEIEANPGTVFIIQDASDPSSINTTLSDLEEQYHEVGDTGTLRLYELNNIKQIRYLGVRNKLTGEIDTTIPADVLINYLFTTVKGTYKGED